MKPIVSSIRNLARVVALPLVGLILAAPASAQTNATDGSLEEIVVISSKIKGSVDIMDEPTSVTAVTGADIEASGIKDVVDGEQGSALQGDAIGPLIAHFGKHRPGNRVLRRARMGFMSRNRWRSAANCGISSSACICLAI